MTGRTHAICGTATMLAITAAKLHGIDIGGHTYLPAVGLLTVGYGSYLPDIDLHRSKMGSQHKFISKHLKHRGITHTMLIPVLLLLAMLLTASANIPVLPDLILGLNVGWVVHIIADMFNQKGVPIFWPFYQHRVHVASILTSTGQEYIFIAFWIGVNVGCLYFLS